MIKNSCNLSKEKTQYSFILNFRGVWKEAWGKGDERDLNKWNRGKIIEIS